MWTWSDFPKGECYKLLHSVPWLHHRWVGLTNFFAGVSRTFSNWFFAQFHLCRGFSEKSVRARTSSIFGCSFSRLCLRNLRSLYARVHSSLRARSLVVEFHSSHHQRLFLYSDQRSKMNELPAPCTGSYAHQLHPSQSTYGELRIRIASLKRNSNHCSSSKLMIISLVIDGDLSSASRFFIVPIIFKLSPESTTELLCLSACIHFPRPASSFAIQQHRRNRVFAIV